MIISIKNIVAASLFAVFMSLFCVVTTHAQTFTVPAPVEGWAWSDTVGWISLNCSTGSSTGGNACVGTPGGIDYGLEISPNAAKNLNGYAWSEHIGWIRAVASSDASIYPSGAGTSASRASVDATGSAFEGWMRACAGTKAAENNPTSGCNVTNPAVNAKAGGWDGWISLSGNAGAGSHAVTFNNNGRGVSGDSYAWGGGITIGWIDFRHMDIDAPCSTATNETKTCNGDDLVTTTTPINMWCENGTDSTVTVTCPDTCAVVSGVAQCVDPDPTGDITVTPPIVRKQEDVTITWDPINSAVSCVLRISGTPDQNLTPAQMTNGDTVTHTIVNNTTSIALVCDGVTIGEGGGPDPIIIKALPSIYES